VCAHTGVKLLPDSRFPDACALNARLTPCAVLWWCLQGVEADLLLVLMLGLSDEAIEVQEATRRELTAVGDHWLTKGSEIITQDSGDKSGKDGEDKGAVIKGGEGVGAGEMTRALLPALVPKVLEDVAHWTVRTRHRSILLLAAVVMQAGPAIGSYLPVIFPPLCGATSDEEEGVVAAALECGQAVGAMADPEVALGLLLAQVRGARGSGWWMAGFLVMYADLFVRYSCHV
jgi:hypothetical protein